MTRDRDAGTEPVVDYVVRDAEGRVVEIVWHLPGGEQQRSYFEPGYASTPDPADPEANVPGRVY